MREVSKDWRQKLSPGFKRMPKPYSDAPDAEVESSYPTLHRLLRSYRTRQSTDAKAQYDS